MNVPRKGEFLAKRMIANDASHGKSPNLNSLKTTDLNWL